MGYSMATPIKSKIAHTKMLAFAREHFRPWHKVSPEEGGFDADYDWTQFVRDDLSYDHKKNRIGFDFTTSFGHIGEYGKAFLRWMALQSGRTRAFPQYTGTPVHAPYTVYDGHEAWPVLVRSQWELGLVPEDCQWCLTNEFGFKPIRRPWFPIERDPRGVETAVVIADVPNISGHKPVIRDLLLKFKATREQVNELFDGGAPYRVLSTDPTALFYLGNSLGKAGVTHSFEYGPFVLDGHRKAMADAEEPMYQQVEAVIQTELRRLTELWTDA